MKKSHHFNAHVFADDQPLVPLSRCRELLGSKGHDLTDETIDELRRRAEGMARVIVEMYLSSKPQS